MGINATVQRCKGDEDNGEVGGWARRLFHEGSVAKGVEAFDGEILEFGK